MDFLGQFVLAAAGSPWVLPLVFLFTVIDGFFPPIPSESVVIALAAISISAGHPQLLLLALAAALGAFIGDNLTYEVGRRIGLDRFSWMRRPWFVKMTGRASSALEHRVSSAVLAARFVPGGRVAVNLVTGASGIPRRVFRPLTVVSSIGWTTYTLGIGIVAGWWVGQHPLLGALAATGLGLLIGFLIDTGLALVRRRRAPGHATAKVTTETERKLADVG